MALTGLMHFQKLMQNELVLHHAEEDSLPKAQRGGRGQEKGAAIDQLHPQLVGWGFYGRVD